MPDLSLALDACEFATGTGLPTGEPGSKPLVYFDETSGEFYGWVPGGTTWEPLTESAARGLDVVLFASSMATVSPAPALAGTLVASSPVAFQISNAGNPAAMPLFIWAEVKIEGYALTTRPEIGAYAYAYLGDTFPFGFLVNRAQSLVFLEPSPTGAMSSATTWTPILQYSPEIPYVVPANGVLDITFEAREFTRQPPPNGHTVATASVRFWALGYRR